MPDTPSDRSEIQAEIQAEVRAEVRADVLVRALAVGGSVRALSLRSTHVSRQLCLAHDASPAGAMALSRVASAALLLGGLIKGREQVSLNVRGEGELGAVLAIADAMGRVRATIDHPRVELVLDEAGRPSLGLTFGPGRLTVTRTMGLKAPYVGVVPLVSGEIAIDLAEYFRVSEQKPTTVALFEVLGPEGVRAAGGFLIQALPGADDNALERVAARVERLPPMSVLLEAGLTPVDLLKEIFDDLVILEQGPVHFECNCSRDRYEGLLLTLGHDELIAMATEQENAEVVCHFCAVKYYFSREELQAIARHALKPGTP